MIPPFKKPTHDKQWCLENRVLPDAQVDGNLIHIKDLRAFEYGTSKADLKVAYEDRTIDVRTLTSIDLFVEPFSVYKKVPSIGKAHTFLSFGFEGQHIVTSVEVRRQEGEQFSPTKGLLNAFEIIYILATERDVVKLRSNHRKNNVFLYPIKPHSRDVAQGVFCDIMKRVHHLNEKPEFYHTFTNNCTTNLIEHLNAIHPGRVPSSIAFLLPGFAGRLAYNIGLIDTQRSYEETKKICRINDRALAAADEPDFSAHIRDGMDALHRPA